MQIQYLEIITDKVQETCSNYSKVHGVEFSEPYAELGNARVAELANGGKVGVRAPLSETEESVVRPYWLVEDINMATEAVLQSGGEIIHAPLEIKGHGVFAIYRLGGNNHGLWQL